MTVHAATGFRYKYGIQAAQMHGHCSPKTPGSTIMDPCHAATRCGTIVARTGNVNNTQEKRLSVAAMETMWKRAVEPLESARKLLTEVRDDMEVLHWEATEGIVRWPGL